MQERARLITFQPQSPTLSAPSSPESYPSNNKTLVSLSEWLNSPSNSLSAAKLGIVLALLLRLDTLNRKSPSLADRALSAGDYILRMLGV